MSEPDSSEGILFRRAYGEWKGAELAKLTEEKDAKISAAKNTFEKLKKEYQEKKAELVDKKGTGSKTEKKK